ncbi:hypothetical protein P7C71_g3502, partial [Lecanoromycetidae sp. Uapishka_2]
MDAQSIANGASPGASQNLSAAERLKQKHEADAAHRAIVEDVVDEEDIAHPPPSMLAALHSEPAAAPVESVVPMSDKVAGKQKAMEDPVSAPAPAKPNRAPSLNMQSEEAFPALGGGPRAPPAAPAAMAWGAKKPNSVHSGINGVNGHGAPSSVASSRASTPTSGVMTPSSTNASVAQHRGISIPKQMAMPGRHSERIEFAPSQLLRRDQLKKPLHETLRGINKRSKANVEMKSGPNGMIIFEGTGPVDATRQALKDLAQEVGSKIPKIEDTPAHDLDDDDSLTVDVTIEGDAVSAEMAKREIEAIVNDRTSTVNMRLRDIPAEFYPFIAGPHNSRIDALEDGRQVRVQVPHYHTWSDQPPPQLPSSGLPQFTPSSSNHIRISGDRLAAQEARAEIERHVQELRRQLTLSQVPIDRGRHQFVLDRGGASLHDLLQETGCSVILPPTAEDTEMLTIVGPQDRIDSGMDKVMTLAMSMQMSNIDLARDIARRHANAPMGPEAHAKAFTRYIQRRKAIEQLERQYDAHIILPPPGVGPTNWEIYSREGANGVRARSDIMNMMNAHPPSRLRHVEVDPFFQQHVHQHGAKHVRDNFEVNLLTPDETDESPHMVLVFEGPGGADHSYQLPRQQPTPEEIANFERSLHQAQEHILSLIHGQQDIGDASVEVPPKFHEKARKYVLREQQHLPPTEIPVQVSFGNGPNECSLRGPSSAANNLARQITAYIENEKRDELERGHITSFDFPQKYANYLIGKRGENINKYREEFDVDIQVKDGKVDITGPKAKADAAKSKIMALGKKIEDEATHVLKIKPQYHRDMIGAKGSQVNHLQNKYNVRINFPRTAHVEDDRSVADDASEAANPKSRRSNQAADEVIVRGPKKGADEAKDELLNLLQWTLDNSYTSNVSIAQAQLPSIIGQGGREMESLRLQTGAQIDVPGREGADPNGRAQIQLRGTKKQVEDARKLLEQKAKIFDDTITRSIDIDKKYHKSLIGSGGANIRNIVLEAGGSDDRRDIAKTVRFPRQDSEEDTVRVEGQKVIVDKIVAAIQAFAGLRDSQTTQTIEVAPEKHRILIGRGGEARRTLESQFKIGLDIPKLSQTGAERSQVKVSGQPEDVEKAKAHILELVKDQEGQTLHVPRKYHQRISDNGQFFRRLRTDHKVTIDHAGHHPPQRSGSAPRPQTNGGAAMPLITDDPDSLNHHFEFFDDADNAEEGEIPWVLHGSADSVAKGREILEKAIKEAKNRESQSIGYLVLPDPKTYRFIIGQGGSQINAIRKATGCKITVPRDQAPGSAIEIVGSRDGVEQARDIILDVVQNGGRRD